MNYKIHQANKQPILPILNQLPITAYEKQMYGQLYGLNDKFLAYSQVPNQQQYNSYYNSLEYGYQSQFFPAIQSGPLPLIQSYNIDPLPINYNLAKIVQQPEQQISLAFDLSDFGIKPEIKKKTRIIQNKQQQHPFITLPPIDYVSEVDLPRIYLSNEQQFRVIQQKLKQKQRLMSEREKDQEIERLNKVVSKQKQKIKKIQQVQIASPIQINEQFQS